MSSERTRVAILTAARSLLETERWPSVGLGEIAAAAGVSRQALYLHFGSRDALLMALVRWIDEVEGVAELAGHVLDAPTGAEAIDRLVRMNARYEPRIRAVVRAHDAGRHADPDLERAWQDRMRERRRLYRRIVQRLQDEGALAPGLSAGDATDLMWAILGSRLHEDLIDDRRWSAERYERGVGRVLRGLLLGDDASR